MRLHLRLGLQLRSMPHYLDDTLDVTGIRSDNVESITINHTVQMRRKIAILRPNEFGIPVCWSSNVVAASLTPRPPGRSEDIPAVPDRR